jgi:uncharacterized membrane protein YagU involved in acid resistance
MLNNYFPFEDRNKQLIFGLVWGLFVFMAGPLMMVPMMSGDPLFDLSRLNMISGVGHLVWGAIMGIE